MTLPCFKAHSKPWKYWTFSNMLDNNILSKLLLVDDSEFTAVGSNVHEQYENQPKRYFLSLTDEICSKYSWADTIKDMFTCSQSVTTISSLGKAIDNCKIDIWLCKDHPGYWSAPHCDVDSKQFTLLTYIDGSIGTSILDSNRDLYVKLPFIPNTGFCFFPKKDVTWHSVEKLEMQGTRYVLIVNFIDTNKYITEQRTAGRSFSQVAKQISTFHDINV